MASNKHEPIVIGLGHYSRTGKDTLCKAIVDLATSRDLRATRLSFADPLKDIARQVYGWTGLREGAYYDKCPEQRSYELEPLGLTPVEIWIEIGNKFREVYQSTWVDLVRSQIHQYDLVVIPDVRFQNEVDMIRLFPRHYLCKVVRPGVSPRNSVSDLALFNEHWHDGVFVNDAGFDKVDREAERIFLAMTQPDTIDMSELTAKVLTRLSERRS